MKLGGKWILGIGVLIWGSCSQAIDHKGKTPLVGVGAEFLYAEDLYRAIPAGLHGKDSARVADEYIKNWVEDALLYQKAEGNIPDNEVIDEKVAAYRKALIMHTYQEELVRQEVGNNISDEEIAQYYEQNVRLFLADKPYIQGFFIKMPLNNSQLNMVRSLYKRNDQEALDRLIKLTIGSAVSSDYFYDQWKPVSDFVSKLPLDEITTDAEYLKRNRNVEVKDTAFCYFLHVKDFLGVGELLPLEYVKNEIKEIQINSKRVDFINQMKEKLYQDAIERNKVDYYTKKIKG